MHKKIASNTIAQILSKVATATISIFLLSILTNYLSVELFGLYSKIYNYLGIFAFLADLGLYTIAIREISEKKQPQEKIIGNIMTLRLFLGIVILFLAMLIGYFIPGYNSNIALTSIFIISIFTIFGLMNSSILALMQAKMKMEFSLFSVTMGKILNISIIALIVFVFLKKGEISEFNTSFIYIMLAGLAGIVLNTLLNFLYARKICKIGFAFDLEYIKHILKISIPYGLALFLSVVYFKIDIILISIIEGPEIGDLSVALYSLPMKIVEVLMVVGGFYLNSVLPSITTYFKENKKTQLQILINKSFKILFSFSMIIFTLGVLFRENIIKIIANDSYLNTQSTYNSSDAFFIVLGVIVFYFMSLLFIYIFIGAKKQGKLLKINLIITIFNIVGNIILIPKYSFMGAGFVTLLSQILLLIMMYYSSREIIKFRFPIFFIIKTLIISLLIFIIGYYLINNISIGLYLDTFIYGGILFGIYGLISYNLIISNK